MGDNSKRVDERILTGAGAGEEDVDGSCCLYRFKSLNPVA